MQQQSQQLQQYIQDNTLMGSQFNAFGGGFQTSPIDFQMPATQAALEASLQMEAPFDRLPQTTEAQQAMQWGMANWQDFQNAMTFGPNDGLPGTSMGRGSNSPTGTYLEVLSLPSSSSDNGWATVDAYQNFESYQQAQNAAIFNPGQTLHLRSHSDSSQSDGTGHTIETFGSFEEISFPPYSPYSPDSDTYMDPTAFLAILINILMKLSAHPLLLHLFPSKCRPHLPGKHHLVTPHPQLDEIQVGLPGKVPPQRQQNL
jgi:hypothetical protein